MKRSKKATVSTRRATSELPQIFVKIDNGWRTTYAKASIRIKSGQYQYLVWRDRGRIRNLYLGRKRNS